MFSKMGSICYIEDGMENGVKVNFFNKNNLLKKKLGNVNGGCDFLLWKCPNLELIHFKNYVFDDDVKFIGDSVDRVVILDNCVFDCNSIVFENCNVEVINPVFKNSSCVKIKALNMGEFNVSFSDTCKSDLNFIVNGCSRFSLNGGVDFCNLMVLADECFISNFSNYKSFVVSASNQIKLVDCDINFTSFEQSGLIKTRDLYLENTSIVDSWNDDYGDVFSLEIKNLFGYNYDVKVKYKLDILDDVYTNRGEEYFVLFSDRDDSSKRLLGIRNLISVLKGVRNVANSRIDDEVLGLFDVYNRELEKENSKLVSQKIKLMELKKLVSDELVDYKKNLLDENVVTMMKTLRRK